MFIALFDVYILFIIDYTMKCQSIVVICYLLNTCIYANAKKKKQCTKCNFIVIMFYCK